MSTIELPKLRIEVEVKDTTPLSIPDTEWFCYDSKGHLHKWQLIGGERRLPTLKLVGGSGRFYYICKKCGEQVNPVWNSSPSQAMYGPRHYFVNDVEVDKKEFDMWVEAFQRFCEKYKENLL